MWEEHDVFEERSEVPCADYEDFARQAIFFIKYTFKTKCKPPAWRFYSTPRGRFTLRLRENG